MIYYKHILIVIILASIFSGCISEPSPPETSVPIVIPTTTTKVEIRPLDQDVSLGGASTSASIYLEPSTEKITIYVPVLLDENKTVLKMYETSTIEGNLTTTIIDTEHGKALKISGSGLGKYLFNWNEVPGKDTDRFVKWLEDNLPIERPDIKKTDDGAIIASEDYDTTPSIKVVYTFRLNEKKNKLLYDVTGSDPYHPLFVKEDNGKLNVYNGISEINIQEYYGIHKDDEQTSDEFLRRFTFSMSNYTSPEPFFTKPPYRESPHKFDAWVYSDSEIEKVRFDFNLAPINQLSLFNIGTEMGWVNLRKGWQVVNLSLGHYVSDRVWQDNGNGT
jgi:hypothetical protein